MADTQLDATLSASEPISGNLSANEGISASLTPDEEVSGVLEVKRTRTVATMLSELEDVDIDDLQDDDILVYDSLDGKWHNEANAGGGGAWGTITGTLSDQTDLQNALDDKYNRSEANVLGAKNLFKRFPVDTYTTGDVVFTQNADGSITVNGTVGSSVAAWRQYVLLKAGSYIVSGGVSSTNFVGIYDYNTTNYLATSVEGNDQFTLSQDAEVGLTIRVNKNQTVNNIVFYPMLRFASDPNGVYQPFAKTNKELTDVTDALDESKYNRSEANILGAKNLLPNNAVSTEYNGITYTVNADGTVTANGSTSSSSSNLKLCELSLTAGDKYIVSGGYSNKVRINIYLKSNPSTEILVTNTDYIWTVPTTGVYVVQIYVNTNSTVTDAVISPMMRFDTDPDDNYVPYALTNKQLTDVVGQNVSDIDAIEELIPSSASSSNKLATANDIPSLSNYVEKSSTAGLLKNDGTVDTTQYISDISGKADIVSGATSGDFAGLDANGNLTDSGISVDIIPSGASSSNKLATASDIPSLSNYVEKSQTAGLLKNDGTVDTTQYISDISGKVDNSVVAPVENGTTASQAYAIGDHFIKDKAFCTAKTAIALGATFTLGTNYTAGTVANRLANSSYTTSGLTPTNCSIVAGGYCKIGNLVIVNVRLTATAESGVQIAGFPTYSNKASAGVIDYISTIGGSAYLAETVMGGNGTAQIYKVGSATLTNQTVRFSFVYICDS